MIDPSQFPGLKLVGVSYLREAINAIKLKVRNGPMPEQNEKNLPKAPAFNPKVKETIAAFKENNNPKNLQ